MNIATHMFQMTVMKLGLLLGRRGGQLLQVARTLHTSRPLTGTPEMPERLQHVPEVNMLELGMAQTH